MVNIEIDYSAAESWDPKMHERMRWLRENEPVYWSKETNCWIISSYEGVEHVSKNHKIFCSGKGVRLNNPVKFGLIDEDEPRHTELRRLLNKGFTPRMVQKLEGAVRRLVTEIIDKIASKGECDFVNDIAVPIPLLVIAEMMGIPPEDRERFHHWSDAMVAGDGNMNNPQIMAEAAKAFLEYSDYLNQIIKDRRSSPRDDLISILVGAKDSGAIGNFDRDTSCLLTTELLKKDQLEKHLALTNNELIMLLVVLLVAGNETTRNALSGGVQLLIENPDERCKIINNPALLPSAVEEMIRLVSPVHSFSRTATIDTKIGGKEIKKDDKVLMLYPSANRDAEKFDQPDAFFAARNPQHLGFGIGNHFCLGANLARMEMRVTFSELLKRIPDMNYSQGGPIIIPSALVRTCANLRIKYTPEQSNAA